MFTNVDLKKEFGCLSYELEGMTKYVRMLKFLVDNIDANLSVSKPVMNMIRLGHVGGPSFPITTFIPLTHKTGSKISYTLYQQTVIHYYQHTNASYMSSINKPHKYQANIACTF